MELLVLLDRPVNEFLGNLLAVLKVHDFWNRLCTLAHARRLSFRATCPDWHLAGAFPAMTARDLFAIFAALRTELALIMGAPALSALDSSAACCDSWCTRGACLTRLAASTLLTR